MKRSVHIKISHIFIILGVFLLGNSSYGLMQGRDKDSIMRDSSNIKISDFKDGIRDRYQGDDFNYSINDTGGINLLQRVLRSFFEFIADLFGFDIDFLDYRTLEYIIYALMGLGMIYLLIKVLLKVPASQVFRNEDAPLEGFNLMEESIEEVDFDQLINDALKEENHRLATRYLYLKSLKTLAKKGIIKWDYDKTNSDYLKEISKEDTKSLFQIISKIYDYVWYGEFPLDKDTFERNKIHFTRLNKVTSNG